MKNNFYLHEVDLTYGKLPQIQAWKNLLGFVGFKIAFMFELSSFNQFLISIRNIALSIFVLSML